ncbi:hypothetical protein Vse01_39170 [Micromonospora sediminimaris]|uniref:Uncharacterized protein n=1 Tax=Micromonospora sediminimaris TaxID=547162 RepID=A0A9W5US53_9ACTN|nr:hypothetical protein Vse01_39170 [Micromonospora sediminimaris]
MDALARQRAGRGRMEFVTTDPPLPLLGPAGVDQLHRRRQVRTGRQIRTGKQRPQHVESIQYRLTLDMSARGGELWPQDTQVINSLDVPFRLSDHPPNIRRVVNTPAAPGGVGVFAGSGLF